MPKKDGLMDDQETPPEGITPVMVVEAVADIAFCNFESVKVGNIDSNDVKYAFLLYRSERAVYETAEKVQEQNNGENLMIESKQERKSSVLVFVLESQEELLQWQSALEPYVVQT